MKIKVSIISLIVPFSFWCSWVTAQTAPKYSNEFLSIGVGARSFAMSNTSVASVSGITSVYWNPAALVTLSKSVNLGLMHSEYFAGLSQYDFGAIAFKSDENSSFGISFIRFGVDNIPNTLALIDRDGNIRFDRIQPFSIADYAVTFTYARQLAIKGLSVGGNAKIIRRIGGDFASAWGFGVDLAAHYQFNLWQFGIMARDITTTINSWTFYTENLEEVFKMTGNVIPTSSTEITLPRFILGAARTFNFGKKWGALAEINLDLSTDGKRNVLLKGDPFSIDPHLGVEFHYQKLIFLRAGIGNIQQEYEGGKHTTLQPNMGIGISYRDFSVDYALTDLGNLSAAGYSHVFSLTYSFDKTKGNQPKL
ncbi:MAG: PorV/PorQ family protein [Salinivirgaceae bacterium]